MSAVTKELGYYLRNQKLSEKRVQKHYTKHFKQKAVNLANEFGVKFASNQLKVPFSTLSNWTKLVQFQKPPKPAAFLPSAEEHFLKKENEYLKEINFLLKQKLSFSS